MGETEFKHVIALLLEDARRIQQLEPNAGTDARIWIATEALCDTSQVKIDELTGFAGEPPLNNTDNDQLSSFERSCNGDNSIHKLKEESRALSTHAMELIRYHNLAVSDPQCRGLYQTLQSRAHESVLRVQAILECCHQPDLSG